jgi:hypothetical protein
MNKQITILMLGIQSLKTTEYGFCIWFMYLEYYTHDF